MKEIDAQNITTARTALPEIFRVRLSDHDCEEMLKWLDPGEDVKPMERSYWTLLGTSRMQSGESHL